jgi:hypothetical protein
MRPGQPITPSHRAAISAANKGRPFTVEHRERISEAMLAHYERVSPPMSPAQRAWREHRRQYKRDLREQRRRGRIRRQNTQQ